MLLINFPLLTLPLLFDPPGFGSRVQTLYSIVFRYYSYADDLPMVISRPEPRPLKKQSQDSFSWLPHQEQNCMFPKPLFVPFPLNPAPPSILQISVNGTTMHLDEQVRRQALCSHHHQHIILVVLLK